jgi:hypothetical protein
MHHDPMSQVTYSDPEQTIDGDFPVVSTNCEKPVVW